MRGPNLVEIAARAIRLTKFTHYVPGRKTDEPQATDLRYAAAAVPAILYELADLTARQGRLSSGALVQLAHSVERVELDVATHEFAGIEEETTSGGFTVWRWRCSCKKAGQRSRRGPDAVTAAYKRHLRAKGVKPDAAQ